MGNRHDLSPQDILVRLDESDRQMLDEALRTFRDSSPSDFAPQRAALRRALLGELGCEYDGPEPDATIRVEMNPVRAAIGNDVGSASTLFIILHGALRAVGESEDERCRRREAEETVWTARRKRRAREMAAQARREIEVDPASAREIVRLSDDAHLSDGSTALGWMTRGAIARGGPGSGPSQDGGLFFIRWEVLNYLAKALHLEIRAAAAAGAFLLEAFAGHEVDAEDLRSWWYSLESRLR